MLVPPKEKNKPLASRVGRQGDDGDLAVKVSPHSAGRVKVIRRWDHRIPFPWGRGPGKYAHALSQVFSKSSLTAQIPWGHLHGKLLDLLTSSSRLQEAHLQRLDDVALSPTSRRLFFFFFPHDFPSKTSSFLSRDLAEKLADLG